MEHKSVPRGSSDESGFEVHFKRFLEGFLEPKLVSSWAQVGSKMELHSEKIGFWDVPMPTSRFGLVFVAKT